MCTHNYNFHSTHKPEGPSEQKLRFFKTECYMQCRLRYHPSEGKEARYQPPDIHWHVEVDCTDHYGHGPIKPELFARHPIMRHATAGILAIIEQCFPTRHLPRIFLASMRKTEKGMAWWPHMNRALFHELLNLGDTRQ